ncbi:hypothetical protein QTN25_001920 [Entamoeba marina]
MEKTGAVNEIHFKCVPFLILPYRLSLLLEGFILSDRVLFLKEFCSHVSARPLFNPIISPRGVVIIAQK